MKVLLGIVIGVVVAGGVAAIVLKRAIKGVLRRK